MLSIGTETLRQVLVELVRSLSLWAGRVVLVNGHGGNLEAVSTAVRQLVEEGHHVTWVPCAVEGDAHAGRAETSLLLHLAPWHVRRDRAEPGNTRPIGQLLPELKAQGVRKVSPNGILGDPVGASAAEGETLFTTMLETARRGL